MAEEGKNRKPPAGGSKPPGAPRMPVHRRTATPQAARRGRTRGAERTLGPSSTTDSSHTSTRSRDDSQATEKTRRTPRRTLDPAADAQTVPVARSVEQIPAEGTPGAIDPAPLPETRPDSDAAGREGISGQEKPIRAKKPESRFGRWRSEREKQREAEIARESKQVQERSRREKIRRDPALDGLRAEDKKKTEHSPLSRAKKLAYTGIALLVVVALYVGVVFFSPLLAVRKVTVQGTSLIDSGRVEQQLSPLMGTPLARVSEERVRELIGTDGALRGVQVEARPPHELVVTVRERVPIAAVHRDNKYRLVDNDGNTLREVQSMDDVQVPLAQVEDEDLSNSSVFRIMSEVLVTLPTSILSEVSEVKAESTSNITLTLKDKVVIQWGTSQDSELKAKVLTKLLETTREGSEGGSDNGNRKISVYDVSSPRLPVTR